MNKHIRIPRGGEFSYSAPTIDILTIQVEQGFAATGDPYADEGYAGKDPSQDNSYDYGDF